ncbi:hypothetical protein J4E91_001713 [Alternaria rosae]|nr:hypothetical protein J4E91_001713 [Alternaria rosae]
MKCSELAVQRTFLFEVAGHENFSWFLSKPEYTEIAASWSISFMRLEQFDHCKDKKKYSFPCELVQAGRKKVMKAVFPVAQDSLMYYLSGDQDMVDEDLLDDARCPTGELTKSVGK